MIEGSVPRAISACGQEIRSFIMRPANVATVAMGLALAALCLSAGGCIVVDEQKIRSSQKGPEVPDTLLEHLHPGTTTVADLAVMLGPPSEIMPVDDSTVVHIYKYAEMEDSKLAILLVLSRKRDVERKGELRVQVRDGVVKSFWNVDADGDCTFGPKCPHDHDKDK